MTSTGIGPASAAAPGPRRSWLRVWGLCLLVVLGSRLALLAIGLLARSSLSLPPAWAEMWVRWDAIWYLDIAANGYAQSPLQVGPLMGAGNLAFFPLVPLAIRLVGLIVPDLAVAGLVLSTLCLVGAAGLLYRMAEARGGPEAGFWAVVVLAAFPGSFVFTSPMTEAAYLLLTLAAFHFAQEGRAAASALAAGLASVTRPLGVLLVPCLLLEQVLPTRRARLPSWRTVALLMAAPLLLAAYMTYLWLTFGDAFAFASIQSFWWRQVRNPLDVVREGLQSGQFNTLFATGMGLFGLLVLVLGARSLSPGEFVFAAANLLIPLCSSSMSMPRFVVAQFPIHLILGLVAARHPRLRLPLVAPLAMVNAALMAAWSTGHEIFI